MRKRLLLVLVAAAPLFIAGRDARDFLRQDSCLDAGGIWFDDLGCLHEELPRVDRIVIDKSEHRLTVFQEGRAIRLFEVALGRDPVGAKQREGDNRTPEGVYPVVAHNEDSGYHRSLRLGYPTSAQAEAGRRQGVDPGSEIMIHGIRNGLGWLRGWHRTFDWTRGCIAVTNAEMDWLFQAVADGTPVEIRA
jgi:murein L,D-transpeptidase YafK